MHYQLFPSFSPCFFLIPSAVFSRIPLALKSLPGWIGWVLGIVFLGGLILLVVNHFLRQRIDIYIRNLEHSRAELELIIDNIPEMVAFLDTELRYIYVDESYAAWYGYTREEVVGQLVRDILPPADYEQVHPHLLAVINTGQEIRYQHHMTRYNGTEADVAISYIPKKDQDGKIEAFFATVRDITEEKKNELALKESEMKYRQLVDNSLVGIFILQKDKVAFLNNVILSLFGYQNVDEMLGIDPFTLIAPEDEDKVRHEWQEHSVGRGGKREYAFWALRRDGSRFYAKVMSRPIKYRGESALYGILIDISEQIEAEERFQRFSEAAAEGIFVSEKGIVLEQNLAAERLFGYTEEEAVGRMGVELFVPEDRNTVLHHMLSGYEEPYRVTALRKDGSTFPVEITGRMMDYNGRHARVASVRDLSVQVAAEEELRRSEERYRSIVQNSYATMLLIDPDTRAILHANKAASEFYGWTPEEITHMKIDEINLLPEEQLKIEINKAKTAQQNKFICKHRLANGEIRDVGVYSGLVPYENREVLFSVIHDITDRVQAEHDLRQSKERFEQIIQKAPIPMAVINRADEDDAYNERFSAVFGYTADDLKNWWETLYPAENYRKQAQKAWEEAVAEVKASGESFATQTWEIRRKDGEKRLVEFSMVPLNDCSVVVMNDITEIMLTQKVMRVHAALAEYSVESDLADLLRKTIDEAEALSGSEIGFYHFVDENQQDVSLQQWSTKTIESYCKVPNLVPHYPVEQAGIWGDCIRTQVPTIHNDYATLENRKGLPEGHAPLVRELVVPILRANQVVAILGVGNKPTAYTQQDVDVVSQIADLSYEIAERKMAEEALQESRSFLLEAQRVARLGSYRFFIASDLWTSNAVLDDIFGIDQNYERSVEGWLNLIHPQDREMMRQYLTENVLNRGESFDKLYRIIHQPTQETRWVHGLGVLNYDADGNVVTMIGTIQDVTERTLAEQRVEKSEARLRNLINAAPDMIGFKDGAGRWQAANEAVLKLFGIEGVDIYGKTNAELAELSDFHHDTLMDLGRRDEAAWQAGRLVRENATFPLPNGSQQVYDLIRVPLFSAKREREALVILGRDITALVKAQEELAQYAHHLEIVNTISRTLSSSLSLDELMDTVLEQVAQVIPSESVAVFLIKEDDYVHLMKAVGRAEKFVGQTIALDQTLMRKIDPQKGVLMINDVLADPDFILWESPDSENSIFRSWMGISLVAHGELVGYLSFDHGSTNAYTAKDANLAKSFATQIAQALANAQLHERVIANANDLEKHVQKRTEELQDFVDLTAGREIRMIELKDMIRDLRRQVVNLGDVPVAGDEIDIP